MSNTEIREKLMNASIELVSKGGLEQASSRAIAEKANVNSAYIYRYFVDKDDLLSKTFLREMNLLFSYYTDIISSAVKENNSFEEFTKKAYDLTFNLLISDLKKCAFVYHYCNSPVFNNNNNNNNNKAISECAKKFEALLYQNTNYKIIDETYLYICNNVFLLAAMKIYQKNITDEKEISNIREKFFASFSQAFKKAIN